MGHFNGYKRVELVQNPQTETLMLSVGVSKMTTVVLTSDEARILAYKLMSFAAGQQTEVFTLKPTL